MNHQQIRAFFALNHTRPKKQLGQNFLINPEALKIILEAGALTERDTVIEIGAGLGCLTEVLAQHAERVIAIEVDELLYNALAAHFGVTWRTDEGTSPLQKSTNSRVQLLNADILKLELNSLLSDGTGTGSTTLNRTVDGTGTVPITLNRTVDGTGTGSTTLNRTVDGTGTGSTTLNRTVDGTGTVPTTFKVIANLPYSITTPILWKLLAHHKQIHSCVLMMQKEGSGKNCCGPRREGLWRVDNRGRLLRRGNTYCHAVARKFLPRSQGRFRNPKTKNA